MQKFQRWKFVMMKMWAEEGVDEKVSTHQIQYTLSKHILNMVSSHTLEKPKLSNCYECEG